jgi:hypothetical protein
MMTEESGCILHRFGLPTLEQIKQLEPFFVSSGLCVPESLLQVGFGFGDIELVKGLNE